MSDRIDHAAVRKAIADTLEAHWVEWIGDDEGFDCGCNEGGDRFPEGLHTMTGVVAHHTDVLMTLLEPHLALADAAREYVAARAAFYAESGGERELRVLALCRAALVAAVEAAQAGGE